MFEQSRIEVGSKFPRGSAPSASSAAVAQAATKSGTASSGSGTRVTAPSRTTARLRVLTTSYLASSASKPPSTPTPRVVGAALASVAAASARGALRQAWCA